MKKFDHLTSLDAIDPLPCRLGGKVASGKPEETSYHMGQKLKPGFSIEGGKLTYVPDMRGLESTANKSTLLEPKAKPEETGLSKPYCESDLVRDFDGDSLPMYEWNAIHDPQIGPQLKSLADTGTRKLKIIVLDSLTPIVDQTISLEKQPRENELVTLELPKERLENKASLSVKIPVEAEYDTAFVESSADLKKVSPLTINTDQIVQWLVALDAAIAAGQIDRAAVASELLRVRRAQLRQCLLREELMNLSGTLTYAIARRFHTEPDGRFDFLRFSFRISVFRKTIAEIESFGPSRLIRFLRSVVSEEITDPTTVTIIPLVLRSMSSYQLHRVLNDDLSFEIPERYRVIMEKEEQRRVAESQAESTLSKMNRLLAKEWFGRS